MGVGVGWRLIVLLLQIVLLYFLQKTVFPKGMGYCQLYGVMFILFLRLDILNADPQRVSIFECCLGNVTLRPIIYLLRINISAEGRNMISKSAI
jgi:hypothetical protein